MYNYEIISNRSRYGMNKMVSVLYKNRRYTFGRYEESVMTKVYIDGSAGTTGLRIRERFADRNDVELLTIPEELRKDTATRQKLMNESDITFLCLPDAAAIEAETLVTNPDVRVIDTSTAHRTAAGWSSSETRSRKESSVSALMAPRGDLKYSFLESNTISVFFKQQSLP